MTPAIRLALWTACVGFAVLLVAAVTASVPPGTAIVAAIACSIIAGAAWTERHPSTVNRQPRPLTLAPRVAAIALVVQALLQRWSGSTASLSMSLRTAILFSIAALGVAVLASLAVIVLRVGPRWAIAGLVAWAVGWVAIMADVGGLIVWSLGGPFPRGPQQLRQLDAELVQVVATAGGLAIGAAVVASIREVRLRHSAVVLLAGYAVFGVIAAVAEHRIELATDFPSIVALRTNRDLADAITSFALAGVLWLYWRRVVSSKLPRAATWGTGDDR